MRGRRERGLPHPNPPPLVNSPQPPHIPPLLLFFTWEPAVFDPSLAPPGKAVVHAYYAASEPYSLWEGKARGTDEYRRFKEERAAPLWAALERVIPDIRSRVELQMTGTPLTHERECMWGGGEGGRGGEWTGLMGLGSLSHALSLRPLSSLHSARLFTHSRINSLSLSLAH
jgi:phytoene dehydrogenase-like protein